jgi:uncharacterized protein (TIGR02391 family)
MDSDLRRFERVARRAFLYTSGKRESERTLHPFEDRNVHEAFPPKVKQLFDDGHYAEATFEAFKFVDKEIQRLAGSSKSGFNLMMEALNDSSPLVRLTPCKTSSEKDEQKGYQFLFAGSVLGIRNPRGHEYDVRDSPDTCLDHLSLASLLLRRLEHAGHALKKGARN